MHCQLYFVIYCVLSCILCYLIFKYILCIQLTDLSYVYILFCLYILSNYFIMRLCLYFKLFEFLLISILILCYVYFQRWLYSAVTEVIF